MEGRIFQAKESMYKTMERERKREQDIEGPSLVMVLTRGLHVLEN